MFRKTRYCLYQRNTSCYLSKLPQRDGSPDPIHQLRLVRYTSVLDRFYQSSGNINLIIFICGSWNFSR